MSVLTGCPWRECKGFLSPGTTQTDHNNGVSIKQDLTVIITIIVHNNNNSNNNNNNNNRLSLIVRVNIVLNRTVVVDSH